MCVCVCVLIYMFFCFFFIMLVGHSVSRSWYCPASVILFLPGYTLAVMHRSGINYSQRVHPSLSFFFRLQDGLCGWRRWAQGVWVHQSQSPQLSGDQPRRQQSKVLQPSQCFGYVVSSLSLALMIIQDCFKIHLCMHISRTSGIWMFTTSLSFLIPLSPPHS